MELHEASLLLAVPSTDMGHTYLEQFVEQDNKCCQVVGGVSHILQSLREHHLD